MTTRPGDHARTWKVAGAGFRERTGAGKAVARERATPLIQNWAEEMARETSRQETAILTALEVWEQNI